MRLPFLKKSGRGGLSIKYVWLKLFFMVVGIVAFYSIVVNTISVNKMTANLDAFNQEYYKKMQVQLETLLNSYSQIAMDLSVQSSVRELTALRMDEEPPVEIVSRMKMLLADKALSFRNAADYHLYISRSSKIASTRGVTDTKEYFETYMAYLDLDYTAWKRWAASDAEKQYLPVRDRYGNQLLLLKCTLSSPVWTGSTNKLLVVLRCDYITKLSQDASHFEKSVLQITDSYGDTIYRHMPPELDQTQIEFQADRESGSILTLDQTKYRCIVIHSPVTGWQYMYCTPQYLYQRDLLFVNLSLYILLLFCIVFEIVVVWLSYRKNYSSVRGIMDMVDKTQSDGENEYETIRNALTELLDVKKQSSSVIEDQQNLIRNNFLYSLLSGILREEEMTQQELDAKGLVFPYGRYMAAVFYLREYMCLFEDEKEEMDDAEKFVLMKLIVTNIFQEVAARRGITVYFTAVGRNFAAVLNLSDERCRAAAVTESIREAQRDVYNYFKVNFAVALSGAYDSIYGLPSAYGEAIKGLEYLMLVEEINFVEYEDIAEEVSDVFRLEYGFYNNLYQLIRENQPRQAYETIHSWMEEKLKLSTVSLRPITYMAFDVTNHLINQFGEYITDNEPVDRIFKVDAADMDTMVNTVTEQFQALIKQICENIEQQKEGLRDMKNQKLTEDIKCYIAEQYMDERLNVSAIANRFGLSLSYISRIFKEHEGESILDAINRSRFELACHLIHTTNYTFDKISEKAGFTNISTFSRVFKKYAGISPKDYRNLYSGADKRGD